MKKHFLKYVQHAYDWDELNCTSTAKERVQAMTRFLKDPNLGMQNLKFKISKVNKMRKGVYQVTVHGSRNALLSIVTQWGFGMRYKLNGKRKVT